MLNSIALRLCLIALVAVPLVACEPSLPRAPTFPESQPQPIAEDATPPDLTLAPGMQIGLVSTTLGGILRTRTQVNPDEPGGGMLVTVESLEPVRAITVSWRRSREQEVERDEPTPVVGIGTPEPTPVTQIVSEEGTITATGLDAAHDVLLPSYWRAGEMQTETSLLWLSREALTELKETRQTRWTPDVLTRITRLPLAVLEEIEAEVEGREFTLNAEGDFVTYEVMVNGQRTTLPAIKAYDDFGNEYVILADETNPLIVKFTLDVITTGVIGIDASVWLLIKTVFSGYEVVEITVPDNAGQAVHE